MEVGSGHMPVRDRLRRTLVAALAAVSTCLLIACQHADLDAAKSISAAAADSRGSFDAVAADTLRSCEHTERWTALKNILANKLVALHHLARVVMPELVDCVAVQRLPVARWKTANALYLDYFVAIGAVAGSGGDAEAVGYKAFAASLESAGALANDTQAKALARASADVVDAYASARRRRALRDFASPSGPGSHYVEFLATSLVEAASIHPRSLDDERDAIEPT